MDKKDEKSWTVELIIIIIVSGLATKILDNFYEMNGFISFLIGLGTAIILFVIYELFLKVIKQDQDED